MVWNVINAKLSYLSSLDADVFEHLVELLPIIELKFKVFQDFQRRTHRVNVTKTLKRADTFRFV